MGIPSLCGPPSPLCVAATCLAVFLWPGAPSAAADPPDPIRASRIAVAPEVDGDPSDPVWAEVPALSTWFETAPADNLEVSPAVGGTVKLAYDQEFLYALFDLADPDPSQIRAPLGSHDDMSGNWNDYAGLILDTKGDGTSAGLFLASASGVKYDATSSDASGENSAPNFFWDAAGRVTATGWVLELRIPFASLRYSDPNPERWGVLIYRNRPRDFRYQYFMQKLPRGVNCFICNRSDLVGLTDLPSGGRWVVAPYGTGVSSRVSESAGAGLGDSESEGRLGLDAKWIPTPNLVIDATFEPDFSQIESDAPQVAANERFALFFPERRPFFLESVDLLSSPIQAVSTRTFHDPQWGLRATGGQGRSRYTILVGRDEGGGVAILPGPHGSSLVPSDDGGIVAIGRVRYDLGSGFLSMLYTGRDLDEGGSNRVFGPDFEWRPSDADRIVGQVLYSWSETPVRPEAHAEWDGSDLSGHAARLSWSRTTPTWDFWADTRDVGEGFRADSGFVPQVGYRRVQTEVGRTFRYDNAAVRRLRVFGWATRDEDREGELLLEEVVLGAGLDATRNSFARLEVVQDSVAVAGRQFSRQFVRPTLEVRPGRLVALVGIYGRFGDDVDFSGVRAAKVEQLSIATQLRPSRHLVVGLDGTRRELELDEPGVVGGELLAASVARLRAVWTFNARSWLRLIVQWNETERNADLFGAPAEVAAREEAVDGSLVFSYQLNWQSVLFVGWSQSRIRDLELGIEPTGEQFFAKISYAFQG